MTPITQNGEEITGAKEKNSTVRFLVYFCCCHVVVDVMCDSYLLKLAVGLVGQRYS